MTRAVPLLVLLALQGTAIAKAGYGEIGKALKALEQQRIEEGAKLVGELATQHPDDPEVKYLQAQVAFLSGDYEQAAKILGALDDPRVKPLVGNLAPLVRNAFFDTAGVDAAALGAILDPISAAMTTEKLLELGVRVGVDNEDLADVAAEFLAGIQLPAGSPAASPAAS